MLPALLWAVGLADNPSDANIIGHVVDATTGEHLSHYNIVLKGTRTFTVTDASGHYALRHLSPGEYTVEYFFATMIVNEESTLHRHRLRNDIFL